MENVYTKSGLIAALEKLGINYEVHALCLGRDWDAEDLNTYLYDENRSDLGFTFPNDDMIWFWFGISADSEYISFKQRYSQRTGSTRRGVSLHINTMTRLERMLSKLQKGN